MCADKASWQMTVDDKVTAPSLTKQDEVFEAAGCQFVWGMEGLTVEDLNALFRNVSYLPLCFVMHSKSRSCNQLKDHICTKLGKQGQNQTA